MQHEVGNGVHFFQKIKHNKQAKAHQNAQLPGSTEYYAFLTQQPIGFGVSVVKQRVTVRAPTKSKSFKHHLLDALSLDSAAQ